MAQFATPSSSFSEKSPTPVGAANKNAPRFAELESKDSVVRYWAAKAVQVLDNEDLSAEGRVRIVRDIQVRIATRLEELAATGKKKGQAPKGAKPAGLGCPKQMARLRESFRQVEAPAPIKEKTPVKKVHLAPRMAK